LQCRGRVHTKEGEVLKSTDNHNHRLDHGEVCLRVVNESLKAKARETTLSTTEILWSSTEGLSHEVVSSLPQLNSLKKKVRSVRSREKKVINPASIKDLEIPEKYSILTSGEKFLLYVSSSDETS